MRSRVAGPVTSAWEANSGLHAANDAEGAGVQAKHPGEDQERQGWHGQCDGEIQAMQQPATHLLIDTVVFAHDGLSDLRRQRLGVEQKQMPYRVGSVEPFFIVCARMRRPAHSIDPWPVVEVFRATALVSIQVLPRTTIW
jgi:hypothetical protein